MTEEELEKDRADTGESTEEPAPDPEVEPADGTEVQTEEEVPEGDSQEADSEPEGGEETAGEADVGDEGDKAAKLSRAEKKAAEKAAKKASKGDREKEALKEQIETLEDKVRRQLAEFENFRTRTDREKSAMFETGAKSVLEKILPVIDNFERGLQMVPEEQKADPFVDGMNRIYKQLMTELEKLGVAPIEAVGQAFDPNFHNAVMQEASEELESGTVAKELQKGYTYHDAVLRHSMVSVVE